MSVTLQALQRLRLGKDEHSFMPPERHHMDHAADLGQRNKISTKSQIMPHAIQVKVGWAACHSNMRL